MKVNSSETQYGIDIVGSHVNRIAEIGELPIDEVKKIAATV